MKKLFIILTISAIGLMANLAQAKSLTAISVLEQLEQAGYLHQINEIKYIKGIYKVELHIPADRASHSNRLTVLQIAKKVQQAGYTHIRKIDFDDGYYEVKALNKQSRRTSLLVSPINGKIRQK